MVDWKKEIKLGDLVGKKADGHESPVATATAPEPAADAGGTEKTSIWKRELRVRKPSEEGGKAPSRFARPGVPKPDEASDSGEGPARRSRFARPGSQKPKPEGEARTGRFGRRGKAAPDEAATPSADEAPTGVLGHFGRGKATPAGAAEEKPSRLGRLARGRAERTDKPERARRQKPDRSERESRTSRFSRFARPTAVAATADAATDAPARGRSRLSRDLSFRRRPKAAAQAGGSTPKRRGAAKKKEVVGLKIGASHLSAAHVVNNGHSELVQVARDELERGIVVGGELRDPETLGVVLGDFFRRHKLPPKAVRLGIGTNRIGVRRLEIAGLQDPSHLENAIRFRAGEVLPIPLEEAVLDYQVVGQTTDEKGNVVYRVLLVVAYRDLVERYVRACRAAGLRLVGIDLEAFALLRSLGPTGVETRDDAAVVIVSIGHDRSTFVVADGDTCEFARVLDWGGGALDVAIARALDRTPSQAESVKRMLTLNATQERLEGYSPEQVTAVYEAVRRELQTFVRELVSSLHFYQNQPSSLGIGEITITGGTAQLPGLAAELQRLIGVSVRVGDPFARVVASPKRIDQRAEVGSLAVAIGLGLEG